MKLCGDPIPVIEGWAMDLYCRYTVDWQHDHDTHGVSIYGHNRAEARRIAKDKGWKFHRDGTATCPQCAKKETGE